jgi:probable F420-dependent oxidoreductase
MHNGQASTRQRAGSRRIDVVERGPSGTDDVDTELLQAVGVRLAEREIAFHWSTRLTSAVRPHLDAHGRRPRNLVLQIAEGVPMLHTWHCTGPMSKTCSVSAVTLRIGIGLFTGQVPAGSTRTFALEYRQTLELVRLAEALGFDSAWVSEHHGSSDGYLPSLLPMLAAFAAATDRIRLGTGVILTPLHDPLRLAEDAAFVDQLSEGRLTIGLGIAWRREEFRMFGVPFAERRVRTEETVEVLRRAWSGERFSFEGSVFRYDRVRVTPPPAQPGGPPILLGGYVDAAMRRAGRIGDGHITDADDLEAVRHAVVLMEEGARDAGRDPGALTLALMQNAFVAEEGTDAWSLARDGVSHQWGAYTAWDDGDDTPERDSLTPRGVTDEELRAATPSGTPEDVIAALRPKVASLAESRVVDLVVRLHYPGMDFDTAARAVELFGERVLPSLKGN